METPDRKTCLAYIKAVFPDPISTINCIDYGEDFFIVEINREWIFRFPRREYGRQALEVEEKFLLAFQPVTLTPLPNYCHILQKMGGYRKLPGAFLTSDLLSNLSIETQQSVARQLGEFLTALHSYPLDTAGSLGVKAKWADGLRKISPGIFNQVLNDLPRPARTWASRMLESHNNQQYQPCVIHGDLSLPDHVLFDPGINRVSGIIDFGDLTIGDPAHDFLSILEDGGDSFFALVTENYPMSATGDLYGHIQIERFAQPIIQAAYRLETGEGERYKQLVEVIWIKFCELDEKNKQ